MGHPIVDTDGDKAFYVKLRNPIFRGLRNLSFKRNTTLTALANEAFAEYLERQEDGESAA